MLDKKHKRETSPYRIFFVGDSHTESMAQAADFISQSSDTPIFIYSRRGTVFPVFSEYWKKDEPQNSKMGILGRRKNNSMQTLAYDYLINETRENDIVVITIRLPYYFGKDGFSSNEKDFVYQNHDGEEITRRIFLKTGSLKYQYLLQPLKRKMQN